MFFVAKDDSRNSRMCVVDTEDGRESYMNYNQIVKAIREYGFRIEGVELDRYEQTPDYYVSCAKPSQPIETKTKLQLKTKVMYGVDIIVYDTMITRVDLTDAPAGSIATIRLSDYGKQLLGPVFNWNKAFSGHRATFILDDKLHCSPHNFTVTGRKFLGVNASGWIKGLGVKLDVSELTNSGLVTQIYSILYDAVQDFKVIAASLIDDHDRQGRILSRFL